MVACLPFCQRFGSYRKILAAKRTVNRKKKYICDFLQMPKTCLLTEQMPNTFD